VLVILNGEGLEATLVKMTGADCAAMGMPACGVCQCQPAREFGEFAVGARPEYEMPVVGHQAIREQARAGPLTRGMQEILEGLVVTIGLENGHARVGAIEDVVDEAADGSAEWSWHEAEAIGVPHHRQEKGAEEKGSGPFLLSVSLKRVLTPFFGRAL
jgi:hypothetical protein